MTSLAAQLRGMSLMGGPVPDWRQRAACRDMHVAAFFADSDDKRGKPAIQVLAGLPCVRCPVQLECLWTALANDEQHGIWGGLTPGQRRQLAAHHKMRPAAQEGADAGMQRMRA